jgi:hypothetical protein
MADSYPIKPLFLLQSVVQLRQFAPVPSGAFPPLLYFCATKSPRHKFACASPFASYNAGVYLKISLSAWVAKSVDAADSKSADE